MKSRPQGRGAQADGAEPEAGLGVAAGWAPALLAEADEPLACAPAAAAGAAALLPFSPAPSDVAPEAADVLASLDLPALPVEAALPLLRKSVTYQPEPLS